MSEWERGFYDGVLATFAVLANAGQRQLARDIVDTLHDSTMLFKVADEYDLENLKQLGI